MEKFLFVCLKWFTFTRILLRILSKGKIVVGYCVFCCNKTLFKCVEATSEMSDTSHVCCHDYNIFFFFHLSIASSSIHGN